MYATWKEQQTAACCQSLELWAGSSKWFGYSIDTFAKQGSAVRSFNRIYSQWRIVHMWCRASGIDLDDIEKVDSCLHDIVTPLRLSLEWSLWVRLAVLLCKEAGFDNESTRNWGVDSVGSRTLLYLLCIFWIFLAGASASSAQEGVQRAIAKVGRSARHANKLNNSPFGSCTV